MPFFAFSIAFSERIGYNRVRMRIGEIEKIGNDSTDPQVLSVAGLGAVSHACKPG